ncbi:hypothetical protein ScPMuIL_015381 [Solemya velum]
MGDITPKKNKNNKDVRSSTPRYFGGGSVCVWGRSATTIEVSTMDNVNIQSLDPRKQEMLEARFLGSRQFQPLNINVQSQSQSHTMSQENSNLSACSVERDEDGLQHNMHTPEKSSRTPTERKRKRKATNESADGNIQPVAPTVCDKRVLQAELPVSSRGMMQSAGTKSPSPQGLSYSYTVPSPQGSHSNSDSIGYPPRMLYPV